MNRKKSIPVAVRTAVWNKWNGQEKGISPCFLGCGTTINQATFHCGHIVADSKGGEITVENLRPVCSRCNTSIGNKNMADFCEEWGLIPLGSMQYKPCKKESNIDDITKSIIFKETEKILDNTRPCRAITVKGKACSYTAKDNSNYCGVHISQETRKPCKARTQKEKLCCNLSKENSEYCGMHSERENNAIPQRKTVKENNSWIEFTQANKGRKFKNMEEKKKEYYLQQNATALVNKVFDKVLSEKSVDIIKEKVPAIIPSLIDLDDSKSISIKIEPNTVKNLEQLFCGMNIFNQLIFPIYQEPIMTIFKQFSMEKLCSFFQPEKTLTFKEQICKEIPLISNNEIDNLIVNSSMDVYYLSIGDLYDYIKEYGLLPVGKISELLSQINLLEYNKDSNFVLKELRFKCLLREFILCKEYEEKVKKYIV